MISDNKFIVPSLILSIFFVLGILIIGEAWRNHSRASKTITVTDSAKRLITSDLGTLRGTITVKSKDLKNGFLKIQKHKQELIELFISQGITDKSIETGPPSYYPVYEIAPNGVNTSKILHYVWELNFSVTSKDVFLIKKIGIDLPSLIMKGIEIKNTQTEYYYTQLPKLKIEIQADAAKDAKERARRIAEVTGSSLGNLQNAKMGVIQITPALSNVIDDYGVNDVTSIQKEITAVVSASFEIK